MSSLTLKHVKYTDAGQYLCTARSAIGEDEQSAYLEVRCEYSNLFPTPAVMEVLSGVFIQCFRPYFCIKSPVFFLFFFCKLDAPKIHGDVAVYTWEGNAVNISCEVQAHPSDVSIVWLRDGLQLPNANTTNVKIFRTPSSSYLQVNTATRCTSHSQITDPKLTRHQDFMGMDLR